MKIALDPYMHRHLDLPGICRLVAELGYEYIELSPRADFLEWWSMPRVYPERIAAFKQAMKDHNVKLATLQPMYRWASPLEDERQIAVRYWKKAIEVAVDMGCDTMISEFGRGGSPERTLGTGHNTAINSKEACEAAWWRSMDELIPIFEREGIVLSVEPHPEDWVETFHPAIDNHPLHRIEVCEDVLHRAAHLLLRRRHGRDAARSGSRAASRSRGGYLQPQGFLATALYRQSARIECPRASAPRYGAGRDRLGSVLQDADRDQVRRCALLLRLCVGRPC